VVAHFWADWAEQCKQIDSVLVELCKLHGNVKAIKVEAESNIDLSQKHGIVAVPTVLLFNHGTMVDRVDGANVPLLAKLVEKLATSIPAVAKAGGASKSVAASAATAAVQTAAAGRPLQARLKELVNAAPVMLFMKGTPEVRPCARAAWHGIHSTHPLMKLLTRSPHAHCVLADLSTLYRVRIALTCSFVGQPQTLSIRFVLTPLVCRHPRAGATVRLLAEDRGDTQGARC
jgi:thiol-disulfide isomerase/thioredoxin